MATIHEVSERLTSMSWTGEPRTWGNYLIERGYGIGLVGFRRSGDNTHVLRIERVVGVIDEAAELALTHATIGKAFIRNRQPQLFAAAGLCNGNGQRVGQPVGGCDPASLQRVTCRHCAKRLGLHADPAPVLDRPALRSPDDDEQDEVEPVRTMKDCQ